jgi:PAS domain S-box-containing protein
MKKAGRISGKKNSIQSAAFSPILDEFKWTSVGTFEMSSHGKILLVDSVFCDILGYNVPDRLLNKNVRTLCFNQKDWNRLKPEERENEDINQVKNIEILLKKKEGSPVPVSLTLQSYKAESSKDVNYRGFVKDITSQVRTSQELKKSQEKYRSLFSTMKEGVAINELILDEENKVIDYAIIDVNPSFTTNSPFQKDQIIGERATNLYKMSPEYITLWWKEHIKGLQPVTSEYYHEPTKRWFNITTTMPVKNQFATIFTEITDRKNAELRLIESELRLKTVFDNAADGILIADTKRKRFIFCNPMMCNLLGYTQNEVLSLGLLEIHPERDLPYIIDQFERQARKEFTLAKNIPVRRKNGSCFYADINSFPITLEGKECLAGIFRDITDRKQAEEQILHNYSTLNSIINSLNALAFSVDKKYCYTSFNKNHAALMKAIYGFDIEVGHSLLDYMTVKEDREKAKINIDRALAGEQIVEEAYSGEMSLSRQYFQVSHNPVRSQTDEVIGVAVLANDLTEHKKIEEINASRLYLIQFSLTHTLDELLEETLNEIEKLTGSVIGFYHFVDEDQNFLTLQNWSTGTKKSFCKAEGKGLHYSIDEAGVWVDCVRHNKPVIHNDYATLPNRKGMPEGHAKVVRELVVPVFRNDKVVAILGVGNKPLDYIQKDIDTVSLFANLAWDITERKRLQEALEESETQVRRKLETVLSPEGDISQLELSDIIDCEKVQSLMNDFYRITNIGIGILDLRGNILVKTGWQDICTNFHRVNSKSRQLCIESDLELSKGTSLGAFKAYKCKNNMWDIATPIMLGNKHLGNIFLGQFLYEDEIPDIEVFRRQANLYGFNETEYLAALDRIPRWNKETISAVMAFYSSFAGMIGNLSYSNIKLANTLEAIKIAEENLIKLNRKLRAIVRCNQFLIKADDENLLLIEICKIICEEAEYPLAWIGYKVNDAAKTITPVAWAGHEDEYIAKALLSWGEGTERGRGPAGVAIRTGQIVFVDDFTTDPRMAPWRENAINHGFYSGLAIPLRDERNEAFGVIMIYSGKPRSIDTDEIQLMEELAGDLAFGIISIRSRKERDRIELLRKISEERFSKVFRQSPVAIAIFNKKDNCLIDVNEIFIRESGYSRKETVGRKINELNLFSDPQDINKIIQLLQDKGSIKDFECKIRRKSGEIRNVVSTSIEINLGGEDHYLSIIQDITERKKAESEVLKLSNAVRQSPVSVIITDINGDIEYVNPKFSELTGYSSEDVLGKNPRILKSGESSPEEYKNLWQTITSGNPWFGEFHNKKKNGELFWEQVSISSIKDTRGKILHYLAVKEDITDKKKTFEDLTISKRKAEESSLLKSAFLSNINHEIRTPLNGLMGFADLLIGQDVSEDDKKIYLKILIESSERLLSTISDIVEMSRIETEQITVENAKINLNGFVRSLYDNYKSYAEKKGLTFRLTNTLEDKDIWVEIDNNKLDSILNNFLKNAIKYTTEGFVELGLTITDHEFIFYVKDSGIGIRPDRLKSIFHRFVQADISNTRPYDGLGLGLSIANSYALLIGGKIDVESVEGIGSTFSLQLPMIISGETEKILNKEMEPESVDGKCNLILIVEDDDVSYRYMDEILKKNNFRTCRAASGEESVEICRNNPEIKIVLMDVKLPDMNGYEATCQINKIRPDIKIIIQTAYPDYIRKLTELKSGCLDYLTKPFKKELLLKKIKDNLLDITTGSKQG